MVTTEMMCQWLHEALEALPVVRYPFDLNVLPDNGIYFFYEEGEVWGHGGDKSRIVRVGTHRNGNFKSRMCDHFLIRRERWMEFTAKRPAPKDRSIFRKNLGRAIINSSGSGYLDTWNTDFTPRRNRDERGHLRDIGYEKEIEEEITRTLRDKFSFRYIVLDDQEERMGSGGLEARLIGTLARCRECKPSANWLGNSSPVRKIRESGLWVYQHVDAPGLDHSDKEKVQDIINDTLEALR
jgi:hypothetical protein